MVGNLGQLIVEITTDLTNLNAGLKSADKAVKDTSGKITEYTNKIGIAMTVAGAAITGAFALMLKATTDYADEIYEVSRRTGIATETLSELKYVAEQTESSFEAIATAVRFLNRNIYEASTGNYKTGQSFRTLGVDIYDASGALLKTDEVFLRIADRFREIEDGAAKTGLAMEIFGRGGAAIIPVLNLGSEGIQKLSQEAHRLGVVLTTENAVAIDKFSDGMKSMKAAIGGLWLNLSLMLIPTLEDLAKKATDFIVKLREWSEAHPQLSKRITEFTLALGILMTILGPLLLLFNQLFQALLFLNVLLPGSIALLGKFGAVGFAAFIGWNIGRIISEVSGLDEALSGPKGLFTRMWEWLDKNEKKLQNIARIAMAVATLGLSEFIKKPAAGAEAPAVAGPVDLGTVGVTKSKESLDETVNLVERHAQKLKELNEAYLSGQKTAQEYYDAIKKLHEDGLDIKQRELDLLNQSIDLERLATDTEYQRLFVMGEGIRTAQEYAQIKTEMANQDIVDQQNALASATNLLQTLQSMHVTIWQGIFDFINMGIQKFSSGFSTALTSIILGTKKASEAFKDFGKMMIEAIVQFLVQWAVQAAISMTLGAMLAAWVSGIATQIAAAWLPAAILASIATMGGADAAGMAALAGAMGAGMGMFAGMKTAVAASTPALTALGEGGIVTEPTLALIGEKGPEMVTPLDRRHNFGDININLENVHISSDMDITELAERLGDDIKTKLKRP